MKKIILGALAVGFMLLTTVNQSKAQISLSINIGTQPTWGPVGYDRADYYYLPDVESYYNVSTHQFIYLSNGRWIYAASLPGRYSNYDLYSGYKVVVNRPRPYLNFSQDRVQYSKYKGWKGKQQIIRDSHDAKYKNHNGHDDHGHNQDHHDDHGHGNDHHDDHGHH